MTSVRLALLLATALLLVAPAASAGAARGELDTAAARLAADGALEAAALDALFAGAEAPTLELHLEGVTVHRIGSARTTTLLTGINQVAVDERATYSRATITLTTGEGEQRVALRGAGPAAAAIGGAQMRGVEGKLLAAPVHVGEGTCAASGVADYCLDVLGAYEIAPASNAEISGPITLLVHGPTLHVAAGAERSEWRSGRVSTEETAATTRTEDTWVVVRATAGRGTLSGAPFSVYSVAPTIRASGVTLEEADGALRVGAMEYRAARDTVEATGAIVLAPGPVRAAPDHGIDGETLYASSFSTRVQGDVSSISLRGAPAFLDSPAERAGAAALLAAAIAGVAYAWQHLLFGAAALYTRLQKPDILDNDVRNRIYDIIRETPGISAREVHRRSEQSWGTVVYHLRQLERHHLVVSRTLGRTRNYYENHGKYRGMEVQLACLQSPRALALARRIAAQPGVTQEQLAELVGLPQPTTSYYVRKLKQAGLVQEQREGRYARYVPHADLPRFIALSEHSQATPEAPGAPA